MLIIGFGHESGKGKDTLAGFCNTIIRAERPKIKSKIRSLAAKLKEQVFELYGHHGVMDAVYYDNNRDARRTKFAALDDRTVVDLWVDFGEAQRVIDPGIWTHHALKEDVEGIDVMFVPDVRTITEVLAIEDAGGRLYKVTNSRVPEREGKSIDRLLDSYTGWTGIVANDGDTSDLYNEANIIVQEIYKCLAAQ